MTELYERLSVPDLDQPVLLIALDGWIDAGLGAATARSQIEVTGQWRPVAVFDADTLLDHRARRPTMRIDDGVVAELAWPSIELLAGVDRRGADLLLLTGAEPDHQWRAFTDAVVDLALEFDVRSVHGLGAYPAPVPHTRPTRVVATAANPELAQRIGQVLGAIEVPAGIAAAIEHQASVAGIDAAGFWAQVPHYAAAMPYPAAALALLESLERVLGVDIVRGTLAADAEASRRRIDALIDGNPEHLAMLHQLESQIDREVGSGLPESDPGFLMTGEELAAELERFLRDEGA